ncbi:MAG TPA: phosphatase PAP2 family protein [Trichocoleus sp.]
MAFEQLAIVIWRDENSFGWDAEFLLLLHKMANPQLDAFAATFTHLGGGKGITILTIALSLVLWWLKRWRSLIYVLVALVGSGTINRVAKLLWHRVRPDLWDSIAPHSDYSFPSGHAMASMGLVAVLVILLWHSQWRFVVLLLGGAFVATIGWTRLYLGVHFPSDILAGWLASIAWAIGVSLVIKPHLTQPQPTDEAALTLEEEKTLSEVAAND